MIFWDMLSYVFRKLPFKAATDFSLLVYTFFCSRIKLLLLFDRVLLIFVELLFLEELRC